MKKLSAIFVLLAFVVGARAALPQPDLIAQIHFAGAQKISASTNSAAFTNKFCSAEVLDLRAQTADKLSGCDLKLSPRSEKLKRLHRQQM